MVVNDIIRDDLCNSCDVHHNLAKVSTLLPSLSVDDSFDFLIQLCNELGDQEKYNIWSIIQGPDSRYGQVEAWEQARDNLAQHKLHRILQWFRSECNSTAQRLTFILKSLSYINGKTLSLLRDFLSEYKDFTNEKDFEPDSSHCPWSGQWMGFSERTGGVDFISRLPVPVSKLILSYVGVNNVWGARLVSKRWYTLVKEVVTEQRQFHAHVFRCRALRPALRNVNPTFANKVALCFTSGICTTGHPYVSEEQPGAIKVILEERNVYCGSYHVHNLHKYTDPHRKIHYCRGTYFATGSSDRKIHIRSLDTGKLHKTILGHAGSIRSLLIIEKYGIVISGSYDLTIRAWSLQTGAYLRLWRGHRGTITCLDHSDEWLISGARDAMVKVWYLRKSVIKRTLHHDKAILCVKLLGDRAAVGTEGQKLYLWDVAQGQKLKVYATIGKVFCAYLTPHYIMAGAESVTYIWNMLSLDESPLFTLPHPGQVLSVQYCYVRCITGCADGKIRVWSLVSGDCIKVIRGNAKGDPITTLFVDVDRLLINTVSTVNSLNFLPVSWDYCSEKFNKDGGKSAVKQHAVAPAQKRRCKSAITIRNHVQHTVYQRMEHGSESSSEDDQNRKPGSQPHREARPSPTPLSTPLVPPPSPDNLAHQQTTIPTVAERQLLFSDEFIREEPDDNTGGEVATGRLYSNGATIPRVAVSPGRVTSSRPSSTRTPRCLIQRSAATAPNRETNQLKSVRSNRPQTAPFVSNSLSIHGHLPSFVKRRPQTANFIHLRIDEDKPEQWQSSWQKLLSSSEQIIGKSEHNQAKAQASSEMDKFPCKNKVTSVQRPKTATARIRY